MRRWVRTRRRSALQARTEKPDDRHQDGTTLRIDVVNRPAVGEADSNGDEAPEQIGSRTGLLGLVERLVLTGGALPYHTIPAAAGLIHNPATVDGPRTAP
jgi:hypothetical protein